MVAPKVPQCGDTPLWEPPLQFIRCAGALPELEPSTSWIVPWRVPMGSSQQIGSCSWMDSLTETVLPAQAPEVMICSVVIWFTKVLSVRLPPYHWRVGSLY